MAKTKKCSCCKKVKSWDDFYLRTERKTPKARCKKCVLAKQREYYEQNKEVMRKKGRAQAVKYKEKRTAYEKEWRKRPESIKKRTKYSAIRRKKSKQKAIDYKGGKCSRCGYHTCLAALEFHHIDPVKKEEEISKITGGNWKKFKKELDKCILLCSNCHRELHSGLSVFEDYDE